MPPCNESSRLLADRLAILLVLCKSRTGDWHPYFLDRFYDGEVGEEIRDWPEFVTAKQIIANWLRRQANEMALVEKESKTGSKSGLESASSGSAKANGEA